MSKRVLARKHSVVKGQIHHQPDSGTAAIRVRGYVPLTNPTYLTTWTTESTETVSLASVVSTSAKAAVVKVRVQDTSSSSYAEVRPKVAVETAQRTKFKVFCNPADNLVEGQGIVPLDTSREIMLQRVDAVGSGGLQTCSLCVVGYFK